MSKNSFGQHCNIPRQNIESCEKVIEVLATELEKLLWILDSAIVCQIHDKHITQAEREECVYYEAWCEGCETLEELRKYWPHLNC